MSSLMRIRRKELGLKQKDVAELTGLSKACIGKLERAEALPQAETAMRIADALDTSVKKLFTSISPCGRPPFTGKPLSPKVVTITVHLCPYCFMQLPTAAETQGICPNCESEYEIPLERS